MKRLFALFFVFLLFGVSAQAETLPGFSGRRRASSHGFAAVNAEVSALTGGGLVPCIAKFVEPNKISASGICEEGGGVQMYSSVLWVRGDVMMGGMLDVAGYGIVFRGNSVGSFFSVTNKVLFTSLPIVTRIEARAEPFLVDTVPVQSGENVVEWSGSASFAPDGTVTVVFPKWFTALVDTKDRNYQVQMTASEDGLGNLHKTKQPAHFVAKNSSGKAGSFDFRVTGIRRGFEDGLDALSQEVTASELKIQKREEK